MVSAEVLPTIREQPLDDSETRALEVGEEGVEDEIIWGGEKERLSGKQGDWRANASASYFARSGNVAFDFQ
jgi:hypothetical protein